MTTLEERISQQIVMNKGKVKVFWDMDGTFVSMDMNRLNDKLEPGFFFQKRPIEAMMRIVERFYQLGADTYILSFCSFDYQKEDKLKWLNKYCSFIKKENIIIIPRKEKYVIQTESKQTLKAEYIKQVVMDNDIVYLVDDNESVLLGTKKIIPSINIISPIDFIE